MRVDCVVYRCARQGDMYLYLRDQLKPEDLPEALCKMTGALTQVMTLSLDAQRKLARVDVSDVMRELQSKGFYLQMPPNGIVKGHLYFGD